MFSIGKFDGTAWIAPAIYASLALFFTAQLVIITALGTSFVEKPRPLKSLAETNTRDASATKSAPRHLSYKRKDTHAKPSCCHTKTSSPTSSTGKIETIPLLNNPTEWPPAENRLYPDMELYNQDGKLTRLSTFSGNVIIVQPVAMSCPLSQAYSGANQHGKQAFGLCFPTIGVKSFAETMSECTGISMKKPGLVYVQILLYNMQNKTPSIEDCKRWARHFDLRTSNNQYVLVATPKMTEKSKLLIPGFHLIDRSFHLRSDSAGLLPKRALHNHFFPTLQALFPQS